MRTGSRTMRFIFNAILGAALFGVAATCAAADADHGRELFHACEACHTEKPEALGPSLKGVFGRNSAALDDFRYSNPMKRANLVWDEANLRHFIADPQAKVKGNRMPFGGISRTEDIDDVIAFLKIYK
jgi:cytochrome c